MTVEINRGSWVNGEAKIEKLADTTLERRADWLGQ
jgi:hypothetical protein